jgi:hypothetical protein
MPRCRHRRGTTTTRCSRPLEAARSSASGDSACSIPANDDCRVGRAARALHSSPEGTRRIGTTSARREVATDRSSKPSLALSRGGGSVASTEAGVDDPSSHHKRPRGVACVTRRFYVETSAVPGPLGDGFLTMEVGLATARIWQAKLPAYAGKPRSAPLGTAAQRWAPSLPTEYPARVDIVSCRRPRLT